MARRARVVVVGEPHHLTQRGNNRQPTFFDDHDRRTYLRLLAAHCARQNVRLLGYCLMTNHVHLVAVPGHATAFARGIGRAHYDYTRALHRRWGGNGHRWQNRFFSCPLDSDHLWTTLRYVDLNPVRAGMVEDTLAYEWSSARAHVEGRDRLGLLDLELGSSGSSGTKPELGLARRLGGVARRGLALLSDSAVQHPPSLEPQSQNLHPTKSITYGENGRWQQAGALP